MVLAELSAGLLSENFLVWLRSGEPNTLRIVRMRPGLGLVARTVPVIGTLNVLESITPIINIPERTNKMMNEPSNTSSSMKSFYKYYLA